jgi:hypothetical protein
LPLPIVANSYLTRLVWSSSQAPRPAVNDLCFHDDAGGHTGTDVYNAINAAVSQQMWAGVVGTASVIDVLTTKLDGSAATVHHATGSPTKWSGTTGGGAILQGAGVVTLRTGFRGRSYRGRIYLPWIAEDDQTDGILLAGNVTAAQTAWSTFMAAVKAAGYPIHVLSRLHSTSTEIVSVTVEPYLKTQRRRTRR